MEEEKGPDRRPFKVTSVCYPACCGHEPRHTKGRNLLSPHCPSFPSRYLGRLLPSLPHAAETEQPSSARHLAECFCLPVSQAGSARAQQRYITQRRWTLSPN